MARKSTSRDNFMAKHQDKIREKIHPKGSQPTYTKQKSTRATRSEKGEKIYRVQHDDLHHYDVGDIITRGQYEAVRKRYQIRIVRWRGGNLKQGKKVYHISGKKSHLIRRDAADNATKVKGPQKNHLIVSGNVRVHNILDQARKVGNVLWLDGIPEAAFDRIKIH
ncbi:MAG: hypothetical protein ACP5FL_03890 [Thermoplasmatota archaeon]